MGKGGQSTPIAYGRVTAAGLLLGVAGVAVLVGWSPLPLDAAIILAVGASLAAALSYAFAGVPPLTVAIGQQVGAAAILLPVAAPVAAVNAPAWQPSATVIGAVVALALLSTSVAYLLYFYLIAHVGAMKTLSVTFLNPVFGLVWSALFLREPVQAGTLIGLVIILASVALVTGARTRPTLARTAIPTSHYTVGE